MGHLENQMDILGYLAVPTEDVNDILERGYVCSMEWDRRVPPPGQQSCHTARMEVPFCLDRAEAVITMRKYRPEVEFSNILEILKKTCQGETIPPENIRFNTERGTGSIIPPGPQEQVLDKKFINTGIIFNRCVGEYNNVPCPICREEIPGLSEERGKVGLAKFVGNAFMVTPCPHEECIQKQQERQDRLRTMPKMTLYHACSREIANKIQACGGKFIRGSAGQGGGGIYFAHTPRETEWKAEDKFHKSFLRDAADKGLVEYVVLECEVAMGNPCKGGREYLSMDFATAFHERGGPYDSVILDRGETGFPVPAAPVKGTRIEDLKHGERSHPGYEFIVYSWDQVKILGEVPRDPVPRKGAA